MIESKACLSKSGEACNVHAQPYGCADVAPCNPCSHGDLKAGNVLLTSNTGGGAGRRDSSSVWAAAGSERLVAKGELGGAVLCTTGAPSMQMPVFQLWR